MYLYIILGIFIGSMFFEPLIINFIYFTNIGLFLDIILSKKNKYRLIEYIKKEDI